MQLAPELLTNAKDFCYLFIAQIQLKKVSHVELFSGNSQYLQLLARCGFA